LQRKEIILVSLLALLNFTHILDTMILMPLGNILMPKWDIDSSQYSKIVSAYSIAAFVSSFAAIFYVDKFDRKRILLLAYLGFILGTFSCVFANGYSSMIFARVITGIFGGLISAQVLTIIGDVIPYEKRGRAMGLLMGGFAIASILGVPLGLYFANLLGWHYPFIIIASFGVLLFPFLFKYVPNVKNASTLPIRLKERITNFKNIFTNKEQLIALSFSTLLVMGHFIIIPLINPYMVYNVGVPQDYTPLIYLVGGISALITANFIGKLADKFGKQKVFLICALISLVFVLAITHMPSISLVLVLLTFAFWFSTATGRTVPGQAMVTQAVTTQSRGGFMSCNSCLQNLSMGLASLISGWITSSDKNFVITNYNVLGYVSIGLILVSVALSYKLEKYILQKNSTANIIENELSVKLNTIKAS
jgi:MFS transporter, DHA1 family, inner membrane transport protein